MTMKPYILGSVVARGGMAEVYRGLHVGQDGFKRQVAIKRILPHQAQNAEFTEMFKDEAHIGRRLQHANIVKVEGFDIIEGSPSIIMEFVDGSDLRALLSATESRKAPNGKRSAIPIPLCVYIIAEAARGLHYAHTRRDDITGKPLNIVHRDISPQNILLSWDGEVKVTDFGIASADRDFKQTETKAGIVKGKYSYMSPEQITGKKCDARTDVFALSVVLWEMLAMQRLFTADNEVEVIELVRNCKIPFRLKDRNQGISEELEMIVLRGLARDPRRRFETMEEFEKNLRAFLTKAQAIVTSQELAGFVKEMLSERREASQVEMRKILTLDSQSGELPKASSGGSSRVELKLDASSDNATSTLTVGKARAHGGPVTSQPASTNLSQPLSRGISTHRPIPRGTEDVQRMRSRHTQSKPHSASPMIGFIVASFAIIGGAFYFKTYRSTAKQSLTLLVRTAPSPVQIRVNDKDHQGGKYVSSPARIKLDPGLNSIEVLRPGYATEKILINTNEGAPKTPPTLKLKPAATFAPVRLEYRGAEPATIIINDGFAKKSVSPQQNVVQIQDLTSGLEAELLALGREKRVLARCSFTPSNTTEKRPLIVIIDAKSQSCDISGGVKREGAK